MLLDVTGLDVRYGRNHAVQGMDLTVDQGEIVTVLGANGAGKSSLLKALAGAEKPAGGRIVFDGEDITGWPAPKRVQSGVVLVPEGRQILISLTVHENLLMGAYCRNDGGVEQGLRGDLRAVSELARAPRHVCLGIVGRGAADAGDQPRHAGAAQTDDARRALARS